MKDVLKGFTGIAKFNPFFALWFKRKVPKIRHFFCPQGYCRNETEMAWRLRHLAVTMTELIRRHLRETKLLITKWFLANVDDL